MLLYHTQHYVRWTALCPVEGVKAHYELAPWERFLCLHALSGKGTEL